MAYKVVINGKHSGRPFGVFDEFVDDEDEAIERAEKKFFEENPNPSEDLEFQTYKIHHSYQEEDD